MRPEEKSKVIYSIRSAWEAAQFAKPSRALWKRAKRDCKAFIAVAGDRIEAYDASQVGHDLWLTRNGHGAGFWDRTQYDAWYQFDLSRIARAMGEVHLYVSRGKVMHE